MRSRRWRPSGLRPYLGDTHVHSRRSDGSLQPEELSYQAMGMCLDFLALTDHDQAPLTGNETGFPLIPGMEFSLGHRWHMLVLAQSIPQPLPRVSEVLEWAEALHERNGALVLAHPWTIVSRPEAVAEIDYWLSRGALDGIELLNTSVRGKYFSAWTEMFQVYLRQWAVYHPAVLGGSDFHNEQHGKELGLGCTYVFAEQNDALSVINAIRQRRTLAAVPRAMRWREDCRCVLENCLPGALQTGIGPLELQYRLSQYRSMAETVRTPRAARALWSGNYRLAVEIQDEESR